MRIVHTADWHLGKSLEGQSRMEEQEKFLDFFIEQCDRLKPDIILHAGDIYDTVNPPAKAEKLFYDSLKKLSRGGRCINIVIPGNHDSPERISSARPLAIEHGIIICKSVKTVIDRGKYGEHEVVRSGEGWMELAIGKEKAVILFLPYPTEKRLDEVLYSEEDDELQRQRTYSERVGEIFAELEQNFREDTINLALSHLFAFGSESAGSERASSLGGSFLVSGNSLPLQADYIALGHIHKPQTVPGTEKKAGYSGSPIHYNKNEIHSNKKFRVVDISINSKTGEKEVSVREIDIPIFKPIEIWEMNSIEEAIERCKEKSTEESWVYLEIRTDRYIKESEIKMMKSYKKDILEIRPLIHSLQNERDIMLADLSFKEQFIEFYKSLRQVEPEKELVDLLMSIIEGEEDNPEGGVR